MPERKVPEFFCRLDVHCNIHLKVEMLSAVSDQHSAKKEAILEIYGLMAESRLLRAEIFINHVCQETL